MEKELLNQEKSLIAMCKFLLWLFTLLLITFIGISDVFAVTYEDVGYLNNYSDVTVEVTYTSSPLPLTIDNTYQLAQVEAMNIIVNNFTFLAGTTYSLEFWTPNTKLQYANAISVIGNDSNNRPITCSSIGIDNQNLEFLNFKFNCSSNVNAITLRIYNSSNSYIMDSGIFSWKYVYLRKITSSTDTSILESQNAQIIQGQQEIINNNNTNTQNIINNQNQNTQSIIDSNKENFNSCYTNVLNKSNFEAKLSNGLIANNRGVVYINYYLKKGNTYSFATNVSLSTYEYSVAIGRNQWPSGVTQNLLWETGYIRDNEYTFTANYNGYATLIVRRQDNDPFSVNDLKSYNWQFQDGVFSKFVNYNEEYCINKLDSQTDAINGLNDSLNDDDSSGATSEASEFFSSFTTNTFGLTSIITAPLNLIQSLTSSTCSVLHLPLPYLSNNYLDLPCMTTIYQTHFGTFFTMYQTITYGIIAYWVIVRIFNQVKDFKNPEHDEIEVVDL